MSASTSVKKTSKEPVLVWTPELEIALKKSEKSKSMTFDEFKNRINKDLARMKKQSFIN